MLSDENKDVLLRHVAAETNHQMAETLETLTEDCVFDDRAFNHVWRGREGAEAYYHRWWDAFAVVPETADRYAPRPDLLIVETRFVGRHVGRFLGVEPTGNEIALPMTIFVDFRDGLLSGERFYWNLADLMAQIGVALPWQEPDLG